MKKVFTAMLLVILSLMYSTAALAGCGNHPNAEEYSRSYLLFDEPWNEIYHLSYYMDEMVCAECNSRISGGEYATQAPHDYLDSGACLFCGYTHTNTPTRAELHRRAFLRLSHGANELLGKYAAVVYEGNVYTEPSVSADVSGAVMAGEVYLIENYQAATSDYLWLQIQHEKNIAWVPAGLVSISSSATAALEEEPAEETKAAVTAAATAAPEIDPYFGRICKIKVSSGRGRATPGTSGKVVSYVGFGDTYTILDSEYIADGSLWLKIETSNGACWIAAGLANIY